MFDPLEGAFPYDWENDPEERVNDDQRVAAYDLLYGEPDQDECSVCGGDGHNFNCDDDSSHSAHDERNCDTAEAQEEEE